MAFDTHVRRGHPILFSILMVFAIIEGSLAGWLVARFNKHHNFTNLGVRDKVRFLLFASWWTVLGSFLLGLLFILSPNGNIMTSVASHGIFLVITWIFWFAGAIAITVGLDGGTNCSGVRFNLVYCNQLNTVMAFAWLCWAVTSILMVAVVIRAFQGLRRGEGTTGPIVNNA